MSQSIGSYKRDDEKDEVQHEQNVIISGNVALRCQPPY